MSSLRDIGEDALIERLVQLMPRDADANAGPGDDCAVIDRVTSSPSLLLLKTDALVENVHFLPESPAKAVGWKAIARVVSDFAAMGGKPDHFLITLALPPETKVDWVEGLYQGMAECLKSYGAFLAGGETSSVPTGSAAVISIAATGSVTLNRLVLRSTAQQGDAIMVTGTLGGSFAGKHLEFTPRVEQSEWLTENFQPTAMMDLSDGLAKDLPRLAAASHCGYAIDETRVPITEGCSLSEALGDGEDFELLFTVNQAIVEPLLAAWPFKDLALTHIGEMLPAGQGNPMSGGWDHFSR